MKSLVKLALAAFLSAGLAASAAGIALAAGDGGDSNSSASTPPTCPEGKVWDAEVKNLFGVKTGKCVDAADLKKDDTKSSTQKQGMIYNYGRAMAKAGNFREAIAALKLAPDQNDPRVLNYLGYSNRKLGNMDEALRYYHAAVATNPDYSLVREYLGEAYVQLGFLEKAREQLSEIERICGSKSCDVYGQLASLIVDSQTGAN